VSPKRGDDVAPPPVGEEWRLRFATNEAAKGWGELGAEAPGNTRRWEYEVTAGGRVRYLVDEERRTVHLVYASTRHPKDTE
jgi:hypothetical protein